MREFTREEINQINNRIDKAIEDRNTEVYIPLELIKPWMIANNHRKEEKPFRKPYIAKSGVIAWFTSKNEAFGFKMNGEWFNLIDRLDLNDDTWQPFPQEKWDALLLEYAKSRGYKNGDYQCLLEPNDTEKIDSNNFSIFGNDVWHDGKENNNQIFDSETGVWAQIIEPKEEKDHFVDAAMYSFGGNSVEFTFGIDFAMIEDEEPRYTKAEWIEKNERDLTMLEITKRIHPIKQTPTHIFRLSLRHESNMNYWSNVSFKEMLSKRLFKIKELKPTNPEEGC